MWSWSCSITIGRVCEKWWRIHHCRCFVMQLFQGQKAMLSKKKKMWRNAIADFFFVFAFFGSQPIENPYSMMIIWLTRDNGSEAAAVNALPLEGFRWSRRHDIVQYACFVKHWLTRLIDGLLVFPFFSSISRRQSTTQSLLCTAHIPGEVSGDQLFYCNNK